MAAALLRISEAPIDRPAAAQDRLWAREVRELSYDAEDCVEAFVLRLDNRRRRRRDEPPAGNGNSDDHGGNLRGLVARGLDLIRRARTCHGIAADVRDIKRRIVEVSERRVRYKLDNFAADQPPSGGSSSTVDSLRLSALYAKAAELVGVEEKCDELAKIMMEESDEESSKRQLKMVSVVGFGGLGKTTLAKMVFEKLKGQFDCAAFVILSLNPNMEKVLGDMLCQFDKTCSMNVATYGEERVIEELRGFLRNKRYFIVIDDIWTCSVWNTVKYALIENECGSRIVTTTRILDVAKQATSMYELKPLSLPDSRKLFYQRISGIDHKSPPIQLAEVSENILKKCGGVPLAIITIASLLASKMGNTEKHWHQVYQSMGSGLEESPSVNGMRRILYVGYYHLPPHLKTCFLYLSLCSADCGIIKADFIWKWICEGFVHEQRGKTLYEVGEEYFEDLINRSIIQPMLLDHGKKPWSYCVHDMMLDLITSLSEEENFIKVLGGLQPMSMPSKIRRLSLQTIKDEDIKHVATMNFSHLRSLTASPESFPLLPCLLQFLVIRVLDLFRCNEVDNNHCKHICNLFHLRFLRLSCTSITEIPNEIGNLQLLQYLDITNVKELPSTFVHLRKLEYLSVDSQTRLPQCFGSLKSLKLLARIKISSPTMLQDLSKLTEVRRLLIRFDEWDDDYEEHFVLCLSNLVNLNSLQIFGCHNGLGSRFGILTPGPQQLRSINIGPGTITRVPRWMSSLFALSALDITLLTLGEEDLRVLGSIPSLRNLYIWVNEDRKERYKRLVMGSVYPFRCLTRFRIGRGAMEVEFVPGALPKLQTLHLDFHIRHTLDQFGNFDFGLENLSSLNRVIVHLNCYYAEHAEVEDAEAAIRKALDLNPNKPTLELEKILTLPVYLDIFEAR